MPLEILTWNERGLIILDQRLLPNSESYLLLDTIDAVCEAIETLGIRGAPAIGVAAAYGVVVAAREHLDSVYISRAIERLRATRPTAVNLFHALDRMEAILPDAFSSPEPLNCLLEAAKEIHSEDMIICRTLAFHGAELLSDGDAVLTHCNAGALATSGYGTALGIVYAAKEQGKCVKVYADETRPLLQGGRLTAWELAKNGIEVTVLCDSMAPVLLRDNKINHVIVGADRITANGDTANKIGTYGLSIAAREHGVPFYVAAPMTTFDFSLSSGREIPIEMRGGEEIHRAWTPIPPQGVTFFNPAFDVTPARNITAIISEFGIARAPFETALATWCNKKVAE